MTPTEQNELPVNETSNEGKEVKNRKPRQPKAKPGRGRPPVYSKAQRLHIASLTRKFSATKAAAIVNAENGSDLAKLRSEKLFPTPHYPSLAPLSMPTVLKIARNEGIKLQAGRPMKKTVKNKKAPAVASDAGAVAPEAKAAESVPA